MIFEHPILYLKNNIDIGIKQGRRIVKLSRRNVYDFKKRVSKRNRRLVRQALKGNKIRCAVRPGDTWNLY